MTNLESVVVLDREDRFGYEVTQLFTVLNGTIVAVDPASIDDWLPYGELITLEVHALDEAGLPYNGIVRFHVGGRAPRQCDPTARYRLGRWKGRPSAATLSGTPLSTPER